MNYAFYVILCMLLFVFVSVCLLKKYMEMFIDKEITSVQLIFYLVPYFIFMQIFLASENPAIKFVSIFCILFLAVILEYVKSFLNRKQVDVFYQKKIDTCNKIIASHPEDWGTLSEKAYCLFKINEYEKAIEVQKQVCELSDNDRTELGKLSDYRKYYERVTEKTVKCWNCGKNVKQGILICPKCGKSINLIDNLVVWIKKDGGKEFLIKTALLLLTVCVINLLLMLVSIQVRLVVNVFLMFAFVVTMAYDLLKKCK